MSFWSRRLKHTTKLHRTSSKLWDSDLKALETIPSFHSLDTGSNWPYNCAIVIALGLMTRYCTLLSGRSFCSWSKLNAFANTFGHKTRISFTTLTLHQGKSDWYKKGILGYSKGFRNTEVSLRVFEHPLLKMNCTLKNITSEWRQCNLICQQFLPISL